MCKQTVALCHEEPVLNKGSRGEDAKQTNTTVLNLELDLLTIADAPPDRRRMSAGVGGKDDARCACGDEREL